MKKWLVNIKTNTPKEGHFLAVKISKIAIDNIDLMRKIAPKIEREVVCKLYNLNYFSLVVATNYYLIAKENNFWEKN